MKLIALKLDFRTYRILNYLTPLGTQAHKHIYGSPNTHISSYEGNTCWDIFARNFNDNCLRCRYEINTV